MSKGFSFSLKQESGPSRDDLVRQTASIRGTRVPDGVFYLPLNVESRTVELDADAVTRVAAVFEWAKKIREKVETR